MQSLTAIHEGLGPNSTATNPAFPISSAFLSTSTRKYCVYGTAWFTFAFLKFFSAFYLNFNFFNFYGVLWLKFQPSLKASQKLDVLTKTNDRKFFVKMSFYGFFSCRSKFKNFVIGNFLCIALVTSQKWTKQLFFSPFLLSSLSKTQTGFFCYVMEFPSMVLLILNVGGQMLQYLFKKSILTPTKLHVWDWRQHAEYQEEREVTPVERLRITIFRLSLVASQTQKAR